jgi:hypothetical protein
MATKYIENIGAAAAGNAATALANQLKDDSAANVVPFVCDAIDGTLKYYDRVNSKVRQIVAAGAMPVNGAATLTVTEALHNARTILLNAVAGFASTLPAATGSGNKFRFVVQTTLTSGSYIITCSANGATFIGGYTQNDTGDTAAATADFFPVVAGDNTFTGTLLAGGGTKGDWFEVEDIATNVYAFSGASVAATDPTTRFSTV